MKLKRIVITGAPGTGKTTIIKALRDLGHHCFEEVSRDVIRKYQTEGISNPFLTHANAFSERLFLERIQQFKNAENISQKIAFYDRGIPDVIAYLDYKNALITDDYLIQAKKNRYTKIFITPPWEAIYAKDNERFETFEDAKLIHKSLLKTYKSLGYQTVSVPLENVAQRSLFILKNC